MNVSQSAIFALCLNALFLGILLGLFYDALRITRVLLGARYGKQMERLWERELPLIGKRRTRVGGKRLLTVLIFIEDFLFCVLAGICMILLFYQINLGRFRFIGLLSAAMGFLCYRGTVGRPIMACSELIAFGVDSALRYTVFLICFPLRWIARRVKKRILRTVGRVLSYIDRSARKRNTKRQESVRADFVGSSAEKIVKRKGRTTCKRNEKKGSV